MSLPILSTQPYLPALHPITPTIAPYSRTQGSTSARKRNFDAVAEVSEYAWTAPFRDGLPTPPGDMNGVTACSTLPASSYGGKLDGLPLPPYAKVSDYARLVSDGPSAMGPSSQYPAPVKDTITERESQKKSSSNAVTSYLQIPSSISNSKGSLAEFAAQMTCLFWFESTAKLQAVEDSLGSATALAPEAIPTVAFQKWVSNILSTTQVSQNVILLALLFIYRLKKFNPGVRGKKGSEYRLMTIALMLGNKFLDDNTYTNKTWAEVSGITVHEIHIMEVEFLSNIRYNLFVSKEEWSKWHTKLGLFIDFFNNAPRAPEPNEKHPTPPVLRVSPNLGPSPRAQLSPSTKLPSPPASDSLRPQTWALPMNAVPFSGVPQLPSDMPPASNPRKRSREEPVEEHPVKRVATQNSLLTSMPTLPPSSALTSMASLPPPVLAPSAAPPHLPTMPEPVSRLPRPNFPSHGLPSTMPASLSQLPSTGRVMPPVYNPAANWVPQMPLATTVPSTAVAPLTNGLYNSSISLPDPSRHHNSPFAVTSATISPAVSAYSVHTPQNHLSPSFFLANRNSPYRPVRSVNTLLIPPPSTSLQQQRSIPFDHMHYQPLGKTAAERKTGLLPYLHHEAWPQPFPQPIFHTTPNY
ncbi:putative mucin [Aspergillus ibericus CBS 121593]|uniref:Mucin n=1 Tax=Aspergillus ibericus CBS 121593 TaxID=1448316 RepID=A0A395GP74_9EURO|nr:hypothetical protein BO80DRAFT_458426 [Aspergillus ibericus CBS 121593]RAK97136.1 hypothetical protein BO80DRAFT_458426 [Aspergillus ibericus CBS 121593]